MRIGFGAPVSGAWATPQYLSRFAAEAEAAGYGSLWTFQRLLVPEGSAMEPVYHSVLDPMVALGYAAAVTSRIRLGVAVVNMPYLAPAYLAKQAASVDVLSDGRLDLGLGLGWMPEEFAAADAVMAGPRCPHGRVHRGDAPAVGRRGRRVPRRALHGPCGPRGTAAGAAPRPPGAARRDRAAGAAAGRQAGRRVDHLQPRRPVPDPRGHRGDQGRGGGRGPGSGRAAVHLPRGGALGRPGDRAGGRRPGAAVGQFRRHPRRHRSGWRNRA